MWSHKAVPKVLNYFIFSYNFHESYFFGVFQLPDVSEYLASMFGGGGSSSNDRNKKKPKPVLRSK
jgi:hypothetical protein